MKGQTTMAIIMLLALFSCEFRWEEAAEDNQPPALFFMSSKTLENQTLKDSLKIGRHSKMQSYSFQVEVIADYPELIEIGASYDESQGVLTAIHKIETQENKNIYQLEFVPSSIGKKELTVYAVDHYGHRSNVYLELMVYENLIPVAIMQYKKNGSIRPGHFEINALLSYDQDEKYGGYITEYVFEINGKKIETEKPLIEYIFQAPGQYELKLKVRDNDGAWSEELRALIPINF